MKRSSLVLLALLLCPSLILASSNDDHKDKDQDKKTYTRSSDHDKDHDTDKNHDKDPNKDPDRGHNEGNGGNSGNGGSAKSTNTNQNLNNNQSSSTSSSTASSAGNTTTVDTRSTYNQVHQVASAIAPDAFPSSPCIKGYSGAVQTGVFGASAGGGKIDKGCDDRETARSFALMGNRNAAGKILCQTPAAKRAHLTLDECLAQFQEPTPVVVIPTPTPEPRIVEKIVEVPRAQTLTYVGSFPLKLVSVNGACPTNYTTLTPEARKLLNKAVVQAWEDPTSKIIVEGTLRNTGASARFLAKSIPRDRILIQSTDESTDKVNVSIWQ